MQSVSISNQGVVKIKLDEEKVESQSEQKAKAEEEQKGVKRSIGEWKRFAKKLKANAEQRAEESKKPGEGMDIDYLGVIREIGAQHRESQMRSSTRRCSSSSTARTMK